MAEIKRVMGRYRVVYDRPDDVDGVRTFGTEDEAQDFVSSLDQDVPETKKNTASGDPLQSGDSGALDRLAKKAREEASGPGPGETTKSGDIQTNAGFTVKPTEVTETSDSKKMNGDTDTTASDQARRLLSGAGGGGPTGEATVGIDPSSGHIPGTQESVLPQNRDTSGENASTRHEASDPTRPITTTTDAPLTASVDVRDVGLTVLVVGAVMWAISQVFD